uniref:Replication protein A 70 kDa DNA-binding subunit B n=1 Tax=Tanacetum cinerariifolium TaxID=118510 RepID=A0A6L2JHS1_TANCI|nr:replication protein A 70 kDa DNA-binding subunit B [Tanacetum cinerariifolium]
MCILHAWLQPLYNNQQVKNMEMIVMDEHNSNMQATVRMDKLKRFQHHLKEGNALTIQRYSLDKINPKFRMVYNVMRLSFLSNTKVDSCIDFYGSIHVFVWRPFKSITNLEKEEDGQFDVVGQVIACEDLDNYEKNGKAGKKPRAMRLNTRCGNYAQQFNDFLNSCDDHGMIVLVLHFAMICGTVGTVITIQEDEGWWYLGCWACHGKDETGTISLSCFNDESESDGSILTEITNLIGNEYAFKVSVDDYNVKKLLLVFIVLRFSNDQEIINYVLACATLIKDNEATSNTVSAITLLSRKQIKTQHLMRSRRQISVMLKVNREVSVQLAKRKMLRLRLKKMLEQWILKVKDGELGEANDGEVLIHVPEELLIDAVDDPVTSIIDFTYPNLLNNINNSSYFQEKAILAPTNEVVDIINDHLLNKFP